MNSELATTPEGLKNLKNNIEGNDANHGAPVRASVHFQDAPGSGNDEGSKERSRPSAQHDKWMDEMRPKVARPKVQGKPGEYEFLDMGKRRVLLSHLTDVSCFAQSLWSCSTDELVDDLQQNKSSDILDFTMLNNLIVGRSWKKPWMDFVPVGSFIITLFFLFVVVQNSILISGCLALLRPAPLLPSTTGPPVALHSPPSFQDVKISTQAIAAVTTASNPQHLARHHFQGLLSPSIAPASTTILVSGTTQNPQTGISVIQRWWRAVYLWFRHMITKWVGISSSESQRPVRRLEDTGGNYGNFHQDVRQAEPLSLVEDEGGDGSKGGPLRHMASNHTFWGWFSHQNVSKNNHTFSRIRQNYTSGLSRPNNYVGTTPRYSLQKKRKRSRKLEEDDLAYDEMSGMRGLLVWNSLWMASLSFFCLWMTRMSYATYVKQVIRIATHGIQRELRQAVVPQVEKDFFVFMGVVRRMFAVSDLLTVHRLKELHFLLLYSMNNIVKFNLNFDVDRKLLKPAGWKEENETEKALWREVLSLFALIMRKRISAFRFDMEYVVNSLTQLFSRLSAESQSSDVLRHKQTQNNLTQSIRLQRKRIRRLWKNRHRRRRLRESQRVDESLLPSWVYLEWADADRGLQPHPHSAAMKELSPDIVPRYLSVPEWLKMRLSTPRHHILDRVFYVPMVVVTVTFSTIGLWALVAPAIVLSDTTMASSSLLAPEFTPLWVTLTLSILVALYILYLNIASRRQKMLDHFIQQEISSTVEFTNLLVHLAWTESVEERLLPFVIGLRTPWAFTELTKIASEVSRVATATMKEKEKAADSQIDASNVRAPNPNIRVISLIRSEDQAANYAYCAVRTSDNHSLEYRWTRIQDPPFQYPAAPVGAAGADSSHRPNAPLALPAENLDIALNALDNEAATGNRTVIAEVEAHGDDEELGSGDGDPSKPRAAHLFSASRRRRPQRSCAEAFGDQLHGELCQSCKPSPSSAYMVYYPPQDGSPQETQWTPMAPVISPAPSRPWKERLFDSCCQPSDEDEDDGAVAVPSDLGIEMEQLPVLTPLIVKESEPNVGVNHLENNQDQGDGDDRLDSDYERRRGSEERLLLRLPADDVRKSSDPWDTAADGLPSFGGGGPHIQQIEAVGEGHRHEWTGPPTVDTSLLSERASMKAHQHIKEIWEVADSVSVEHSVKCPRWVNHLPPKSRKQHVSTNPQQGSTPRMSIPRIV